MTGENMVLYLRGEKTLEDLRRERNELIQARRERRHLLDERDLEILDVIRKNPELLKPHFSNLSRKTDVPMTTLSDRWKRLLKKKVRIVIAVQPVREQGEDLKALSSPSEASRRAYRKAFPSLAGRDGASSFLAGSRFHEGFMPQEGQVA